MSNCETTWKLGAGYRRLSLLMLTLPVSACLSVSEAVICEGTARATDAHAEALLVDAGPQSLVTGDVLIAQLDAGCGR
jgi:hypothetical protein